DTLVEAARVAVERTPTLLPALAEAGVVDSGGQGVYVLLQGLAASLKGEPLEAAAPEALLEQDWLTVTQELHKTEDSLYGYCTEFLVVGRDLDLEAIRSRMQELGDSVLVVGDDQLLRVHLHTDDPGAALSQGTRAGSLSQVKVDNIHEQAEQFLETHEKRRAPEQLLTMAPPVSDTISLIAVASGGGLQEVFRSLGVTVVVSGGPTMNPSVQELLQAAEACPTEDVIILPNDKNIIMTAEQARALTDKRLHILSTRTIPQGIAAALALHPELDVEANVVAMNEAIRGVHTIEVTRATRDVEIEEVAVRKGQMIAIVDERLALTAENPESALLAAVAMFSPKEGLLCLYCGADTPTANVLEVKRQLSERYPDCEVEIVSGGQPHYFYIASLE
ncbi:MAG TPA: DAK2 domain-containing protein, partial [Dehalococcoidia bacterium]|nr:DAK2 domain-containing protein [Dehalococcoidia bacterium]